MATEKTFLVVGVSEHNGVFKVRYANSLSRAKVLARNGHTNVELVQPFDTPERQEELIDAALDMEWGCQAAVDAVMEEARALGFLV